MTHPAGSETKTDTHMEAAVRDAMDRWKAAVDAHEPDKVADVFTEDAIFQGTHPYSVGRPGVAAYYDSQPLGMQARYQIVETRRLAEDLALGFLEVVFAYVDKDPLPVHLGVLLKREADTWNIAFYQVSSRV